MSRLAPDLFQRRFSDLVGLGRSRLPSLAPAWTDHNAHDPGITLIELLAWVAEAQLYSLARPRRDERRAYAALMGVEPHGARPALGLIWPDHDDPDGPAATIGRGRVIEPDAAIHLDKSETPGFRTVHRQLWIPARIDALSSWLGDGTKAEHLTANRRGGPAFHPFGEEGGEDAVLRMTLAATGAAPLIEPSRPRDARLILGVRTDVARGALPAPGRGAPLEAVLVVGGDRFALPVVEDGSRGLLRTGALVLDLAAVEAAPETAVLELSAPDGFARAPRLLRIEPNVVPVVQRCKVADRFTSDGTPDQGFDLETPGLQFEPGGDPVGVEIERPAGPEAWMRTDRLADCGPADRRFALDPAAARISFGNGVNGAVPPVDTPIFATYSVTDGKAGNLAANRKWVVPGFSGLFGVNSDPTAGGEDPSGWLEQRREARRLFREGHGLVSGADFEAAARALPGLEVGRARMMPVSAGDSAAGMMRLVVMRARGAGAEPRAAPEMPRWLEAVRAELAPRTPLGARLRVIAPAYVDFTIRTRVCAEPKKDPAAVANSIADELIKRLTLVGPGERSFGLPLSQRDLTAWIQALPDVRRVESLAIVGAGGEIVEKLKPSRNGLPRIDLARSDIDVSRGGAP